MIFGMNGLGNGNDLGMILGVNDFEIILEWWLGMVLEMILERFWDDFGVSSEMILGWFGDDLGMNWGWFWNDFGNG